MLSTHETKKKKKKKKTTPEDTKKLCYWPMEDQEEGEDKKGGKHRQNWRTEASPLPGMAVAAAATVATGSNHKSSECAGPSRSLSVLFARSLMNNS